MSVIPTQFEFSKLPLKINTPLVSMEEKAFFLKNYVSKNTVIHFDGKNNIVQLDIDDKNATSLYQKLLNRVGDYLKTGNISLGSINTGNYSKREAIEMLRSMIDKINIQFDMYVRANHSIKSRIEQNLFDGQQEFNEHYLTQMIESGVTISSSLDIQEYIKKKQYALSNPIPHFEKNEDNYISQYIDGIHPQWKAHNYQIDFINLCRKNLLWINAYATGLGKTSTSLMVLQDQHNLGLKNRSVICVPKSTISNWYKESFVGNPNTYKPSVYSQKIESECIFINLIDSSTYKNIKKTILKNSNNGNIILTEEQKQDPSYILVASLLEKNQLSGMEDHYDYLSLSVDEQLKLVRDNVDIHGRPKQYKKIFLSHHDFYRLRLKEDTVADYIKYLKLVDSDLAKLEFSESNQYQKRVKKTFQVLNEYGNGKNKLELFLEDFHIDSLIIDEEHIFKNSIDPKKNNFTRVKYFSTPTPSDSGMDLLAKSHYIKKSNIGNDGILGLTATPLTNSPLEIYSILAIVIGEYFINKLLSVTSLNEFLQLFCIVDNEEDYTVDGEMKNFDIFKGINNLQLLREVLFKCVYFLHSDDENVQNVLTLPEKIEKINSIPPSSYHQKKILEYKAAFNLAKEAKALYDVGDKIGYESFLSNPQVKQILNPIMDKFHEHPLIIASPFNFIRKMEKLILDEDLIESASIFFIDKKYQKEVQKAVDKFNKKKIKQKDKYRINPHTKESAIFEITEETYENSQGELITKELYSFYTEAHIVDLETTTDKKYNDILSYIIFNNKHSLNPIDLDNDLMVVLDTLKYQEQELFFSFLCQEFPTLNESEVSKLIKFNISKKLNELLKEIELENSNPRGKKHDGSETNLVKQLVFCDYLGTHFKLKHLIFSSTSNTIPLNKIEIITGQYNGENDIIQSIQDYFNNEESENKYQIIIANEKAQEGINLQNGTQSIHHLTIGWTPDSVTQRNGRSVRQGNKTEFVSVNFYDLQNTFDSYKRTLVNKKNDWINIVTQSNTADYVYIIEMLSQEQQNKMIQLIGESDKETVEEYETRVIEENKAKERERIKKLQDIYLNFLNPEQYQNQSNNIDNESSTPEQYAKYYLDEFANILKNKINKAKMLINHKESLYDLIKGNYYEIKQFVKFNKSSLSNNDEQTIINIVEWARKNNQSALDKISNIYLKDIESLCLFSNDELKSFIQSDLHQNKLFILNKTKSKKNVKNIGEINNNSELNESSTFLSIENIDTINAFLNRLGYQIDVINPFENKHFREVNVIVLINEYLDKLISNKLTQFNLNITHFLFTPISLNNSSILNDLNSHNLLLSSSHNNDICSKTTSNSIHNISFDMLQLTNGGSPCAKSIKDLIHHFQRTNPDKLKLLLDLINFVGNSKSFQANNQNVDNVKIIQFKKLFFNEIVTSSILSDSSSKYYNLDNLIGQKLIPILLKSIIFDINQDIVLKKQSVNLLINDDIEIEEAIKDLNSLNNNIFEMASNGFKLLAENELSYYPKSLLDNPSEIYHIDDMVVGKNSFIFSINDRLISDVDNSVSVKEANNYKFVSKYMENNPNIDLRHNEDSLKSIFDELKLILSGVKYKSNFHAYNIGFQIYSDLKNFLNQHKIKIFKFGETAELHKVHPIESSIFKYNLGWDSHYSHCYQFGALSLLQNKMGLKHLNKYSRVKSAFYGALHRELDSINHFVIYENNPNHYHNILEEVCLLLEYGIIDKNNPYLTIDEIGQNKQSSDSLLLVKKALTDPSDRNYFDYKNMMSFLEEDKLSKLNLISTPIFEKKFGLNVLELSKQKINMILSVEKETKQNYQTPFVNNVELDNLDTIDMFFVATNITIPDSDFFIIKHPKSFELYQKYQFRNISEALDESIYFHRTSNTSYKFATEKNAFLSLSENPDVFNNAGFDKTWIVGKNTLKQIIYNLIYKERDNSLLFNLLSVYLMSGQFVNLNSK